MTSPQTGSASLGPAGRPDRSVVGVATVVVLGAILSILDITIVNVAINELAAQFDATLDPSSGWLRPTCWLWPR